MSLHNGNQSFFFFPDEAKFSKDSEESRGGKDEQNTGSEETHLGGNANTKADETHNEGSTKSAGDATPLTPSDKTAASSHKQPNARNEKVEDQCKETSSKLTLAESILAFDNLSHEELPEKQEVPERHLPEVVELKIEKVNFKTIHDLPPGITDTPHENHVSGLIRDRSENATKVEVPLIRSLPQHTSSGVPVSDEKLLNKLDDGTPNREPVTGPAEFFKSSNDGAVNNEVVDVITPHNKVVGETLVKPDVHKSSNEQPPIGSVATIKPQDENKHAHAVEPLILEETKPSLRLTKIPKRLHLTDSAKTGNFVSSPTASGVSPTKEVGIKTPSKEEEKSVVSDKFKAALIDDSKNEKLGKVAKEVQEKSSAIPTQTGKTPTENIYTSSQVTSNNESPEKVKDDEMHENSESTKQGRTAEVALVSEDKVVHDAAAAAGAATGAATTTATTKIAEEAVIAEKKQQRSELHFFTTGTANGTGRETEKPKPSTAILVAKPINEASYEGDKPKSTTAAPMVKPINEASLENDKPKSSTTAPMVKPINEASLENDKPKSSTTAPMVKPIHEASFESDKPKSTTAAPTVKPINDASFESDKPKSTTAAPTVKPINDASFESDKPKSTTAAPTVKPINEVSIESDKPKSTNAAPTVKPINETSLETDKPKSVTSSLTVRSINEASLESDIGKPSTAALLVNPMNEASQETDKPNKPSTAILVGKPINEASRESDKSKSKIAALTVRPMNEASQETDKPRPSSASLAVQPITPPPEKRSPKKSRERTIVPRSVRMNDHIVKSKNRSSNEMSAESSTWNDPGVRRTESESDTSPSQPWWKESEESEIKKEGPTSNPWLPTRTSAGDDAQSFSSPGSSVFDDNFVEPIVKSDHSHHLAASSPDSHVPDLVSAAPDCVLEREPLISLDEDVDAFFATSDAPMSSPKTSLTIAQDTTKESTSVEEVQQIADIDQVRKTNSTRLCTYAKARLCNCGITMPEKWGPNNSSLLIA